MLYGGAVVHPGERTADVLRFLPKLSPRVPDEVSLMAARRGPAGAAIPAALHGRPVMVIGACDHGGLIEGEQALRPVREFVPPAVDLLGPIPYVALQQMVDAFTPRGLHYYVKSEWLGGLPDGVVEALVEHHLSRTSPLHASGTH